jgi:hypothetical protein
VLDSSLAFRLSFAAQDTENLTLTVTVAGKTATYNVSDLSVGGGKYLLVYDGIIATQFDELITIEFKKNGITLGTGLTYSVNSYIYYIRSIAANEKLSALTEAIACYGVSAKAYADSQED